MLDAPRVNVLLKPASRFVVVGEHISRVRQIALQWQALRGQQPALPPRTCRGSELPPPCEMHVAAPPNHIGLGVGTQLTLAVSRALSEYFGEPFDGFRVGLQLGRGRRSSIGLFGHDSGGMIVDRGHLTQSGTGSAGADGGHAQPTVGELGGRIELPESWRIVVMVPDGAPQIWGTRENKSFQQLQGDPTTRPCGDFPYIADNLVAAATEGDFDRFSNALYEFGISAGMQFKEVQGGPFHGPQVTQLVEWLRARGISGVGQSSWGPAVFAFVPTLDDAVNLSEAASARQLRYCWISRPDNFGCRLHTVC